MKVSTKILGFLSIAGTLAIPAQAGLVVTNGDFETPDIAASLQVQDVPDWFDSTVNFTSWHRGESADPQENGTQMLALGTNGFAYQSLGTMDASDGLLNWSLDKARFADGVATASLIVRFYAGNAVGADGTAITALGLTQIGPDITLDPFGTDASGTGVMTETGSVDLSSLSAGTQVWISLTVSNSGFSPFDNISVQHVVPEPGSLALLGLGGLAMLRRRRQG